MHVHEYRAKTLFNQNNIQTPGSILINTATQVSKVIKNALSKELIKIADTESPRSGYYPF